MIVRTFTLLLFILLQSSVVAEESWGPDLLKFHLEQSDAMQSMIWISGFSYSSTAFLRKSGCLSNTEFIGSKELIMALNQVYSTQTITAEQATSVLEKYLSERCQ